MVLLMKGVVCTGGNAVFILFILRGKFLLYGAADHDVIIKPINADVPDTHQCVQASLVSILTHWI